MTNVTVVSYQTGGSGGEDRLTENVTLHFEALSGVYRQQNLDGTPVRRYPSSPAAAVRNNDG